MLHIFAKTNNNEIQHKFYNFSLSQENFDVVSINLKDVIEQIEKAQKIMKPTKYYDPEKNEMVHEPKFRDSVSSTKSIHIKFKNKLGIVAQNDYEYIMYNKGGRFLRHKDRKIVIECLFYRRIYKYTLLIMPPQIVEGGELLLYDPDPNIEDPYRVSPHDKLLTIVAFEHSIHHESTPIVSGTKKILKSSCAINENLYELKYKNIIISIVTTFIMFYLIYFCYG